MCVSRVLVTGSSGTIGTALCEALLDEGYDVTGVDIRSNQWSDRVDRNSVQIDLGDESTLKELPDSADLVVHLAANARVHKLVEDPTQARENFDTTFNVLEYAREIGADFLFSSSREVYGNNGKIIYDETDTYVDECESPYTASKIGGEALVKSYDVCYEMETSIVRFSNVYGKYDASDRVVPLFIAKSIRGENLTVFGDDKILDFTHIDDCVDGVMRVVNNFSKASGTTFNIASGRGTSLVELAEILVEITDSDVDIQVESNRTGEVARYVADISKAEQLLGYDPEYSTVDGLTATVDWYTKRTELFDRIIN